MADDILIIKKRGDGCKTFSIRIDECLAEKIDNIAAEAKMSRNEMIGELFAFAVERCKLPDRK